ncbi:MAG: DUF2341 domain-containing protein, partial [Steroidobacteraceae bacterium]
MIVRRPGHWLLVLVALLGLAPTAWSIAPPGQWWNASYAQRMRISVTTTTSIVNGYSVDVVLDHAALVTAGDALASGNDVRIVYWTGAAWTELDRVVDYASAWNSATTTIWFKTQAAIGTNTFDDNYYLYYGNVAAGTPPADADNIFLLYDDFGAASVDTSKWTVSSGGSATQLGGVLTVGAGTSVFATAAYAIGTGTRWESQLRQNTAFTSGSTYGYFGASDTDSPTTTAGNYFSLRPSSSTTQHTGRNRGGGTTDTTGTIGAGGATTLHVHTIDRIGTTQINYSIAGGGADSNTTGIPTGNLRARLANPGTGIQQEIYDWVRVRNFVSAEPVPSLNQVESYAPLAWWQFDEPTWNNVPNQVLDASGNGHTLTPSGPVTAFASPALAGSPGTCRYGVFDGTNDYLQTADDGTFDLTDAVTAMAWIYLNTATLNDIKSVLSKDTNFEFHIDTNRQLYWWWNGSPQQLTTTGTPIPAQTWVHVAVAYQSGNQKIYINGVQRATLALTGTLSLNNLPLQIGQDQGIATRFFPGRIDEVRIYNRALSQAEVQTAMNATHPCVGLGVDHFVITHDGYGINCVNENITVALRDAANAPYTTYTQQVTLDTQTGKGTWSLVTGGGTFTDAVANDGIATYT